MFFWYYYFCFYFWNDRWCWVWIEVDDVKILWILRGIYVYNIMYINDSDVILLGIVFIMR